MPIRGHARSSTCSPTGSCCEAGSLVAALGGLDTLVFTGGIGAHAQKVQAAVYHGLAFAGVLLGEAFDPCRQEDVAAAAAEVQVRIVPADEEWEIALSIAGLNRKLFTGAR